MVSFLAVVMEESVVGRCGCSGASEEKRQIMIKLSYANKKKKDRRIVLKEFNIVLTSNPFSFLSVFGPPV